MSDCHRLVNPVSEHVDAPSGIVTEWFGCRIDRGMQGQLCPLLGKFAGQYAAFTFVWPNSLDLQESNVGESVGTGRWLLDMAVTVGLVCRTLCYCFELHFHHTDITMLCSYLRNSGAFKEK